MNPSKGRKKVGGKYRNKLSLGETRRKGVIRFLRSKGRKGGSRNRNGDHIKLSETLLERSME